MGQRTKRPVSPELLVPGLNAAIDLLRHEAKNCRDAADHAEDSMDKRAHEFAAFSFESAADFVTEQKRALTAPKPVEVDPRQIPLFGQR